MRFLNLMTILVVIGCATTKPAEDHSNLGTWEEERRYGGLELEFTEDVLLARGKNWCIKCKNPLINDRGQSTGKGWTVCLDPITGMAEKNKEIFDNLKGVLRLTSEMAPDNLENPIFKNKDDISIEMYFKFADRAANKDSLPSPAATVKCLNEADVPLEINDAELQR